MGTFTFLFRYYIADELIEVTDKHLSDSKSLFVTDDLKIYAEYLSKKYGKNVKKSYLWSKSRSK